jgi:acyl-coenzyme A thioesterase PaaI-like protein
MASFGSWLGFQPGARAHEIVLDTRPEHEVVPGTIHFAVLTTLGEVAAASAAGAGLEGGVVPAALHAQFVARARPGTLAARGTLLRRGGRLAFARGEVEQDGRLVAAVDVTFALV